MPHTPRLFYYLLTLELNLPLLALNILLSVSFSFSFFLSLLSPVSNSAHFPPLSYLHTHYLSLITLIQDEITLVLSHLNSSDYIDFQLHQRLHLNDVVVVVAAAAADVEQQRSAEQSD